MCCKKFVDVSVSPVLGEKAVTQALLLHAGLQDGPPEGVLEAAAALDGWIEGPTWASPLNTSQLTALLLLLHAARELCEGRGATGCRFCEPAANPYQRYYCNSTSMIFTITLVPDSQPGSSGCADNGTLDQQPMSSRSPCCTAQPPAQSQRWPALCSAGR